MAVIKAVSSKAGIGQAIDYVTKEEKTEEKLVSGLHCEAETAKEEMQATKELWEKTGGRTYKHFVQSYHKDEKITPEQAHRNALQLAENTPAWKGFEVLVATHKDKDHIHTHFIVNSVNFEDGHKLQWSSADLRELKERCNAQSQEQGLHVPEKGKTFEGAEREAWGKNLMACLSFATGEGEEVIVKTAISSVSTSGAKMNMQELDGLTFDSLKEKGEELWEKELQKYRITTDRKTKETFYTSAYHAALHPFVFQDVDGRFRGLDKNIEQAKGFTNYTTFSLWDTYRALHPWFNLVHQDINADIANSMLAHFDKSVEKMLPIWSFYGNETWCMIGYHAVSVLADMIVKGVKGFDYERAYEAMKTTALNEHYDCLPDYMRNGYVPFDKEAESVSKTLEYAYDDYCIAQAAKALGKMDDYQYFLNRSLSYQTLIDPETKYMRGRDSQGNWRTPFTPVAYQGPGSVNGWGDITEGFTMQYTWTVPHDVQGYINLAGKKLFEKRLDDLFTVELPDDIPGAHDIQGRIGGYWHGNEPCHHIAYLYNYLGKPWKCQKWIREIVARFYGNEPGSLSGNDDCGQMSAWYMFNCAGFYPVAPSSNIYNIGSPCVEALSIRMSNGKEIKMTTENWSEENVYIKELYVNGKKYDKSYLTYEDVQAGITLHFVMSGKPNYKRAVSADARPASLSSPGKTMFYQISDSK